MSLDQYLRPCRSSPGGQRHHAKGINPGYKTNPCADCQRYTLYPMSCPWEQRWEPVPGWTAKPVKLVISSDKNRMYIADTWHILHCPLYIPPNRTNEQDGTDNPYWDNLREF